MRKILDLPEYDSVASELKADSDTELLLNFILYVRLPPFACLACSLTPDSFSQMIACRILTFKTSVKKLDS